MFEWLFGRKAEPIPKDGMGFDLITNPDGQGSKVSPAGEAAWREWTKANPPPLDGHSYISSALYPEWRRND